MKKYAFSKEICYSRRLKSRTHLKYALTCSLSVLFSAGLVLGITSGVVHRNNYIGQGGAAEYRPEIDAKPGEFNPDPEKASGYSPKPNYIKPGQLRKVEEEAVSSSDESISPVDVDEAISQVEATDADAGLENPVAQEESLSLENMEIKTVPLVASAYDEDDYDENEENPLHYTVYRLKNGETASSVAEHFGISTDTILSVNGVTNATRMATGAYLKVPALSGIIYEVSRDGETLESIVKSENKLKKVSLDLEVLEDVNGVKANEALSVGQTLFLVGDKLSNDERAAISGTSFKKPLRNTYYISSPFGWRANPFNASKRSYHNGLDLACPTGTPIYATAAGTVVTAGYTNVYGNYVVIKHSSGYKSLYGHMSSIGVKSGQYVDQGTVIGKVGSTGQSTGPHLHFTIYKNDKAISPYEKVSF